MTVPTHETSLDILSKCEIEQQFGPPDETGKSIGRAYALRLEVGEMIVVPRALIESTEEAGEDPFEMAAVVLKEQLRVELNETIDDPELMGITDMAIAYAESLDTEDGPGFGAALREQFDALIARRQAKQVATSVNPDDVDE